MTKPLLGVMEHHKKVLILSVQVKKKVIAHVAHYISEPASRVKIFYHCNVICVG